MTLERRERIAKKRAQIRRDKNLITSLVSEREKSGLSQQDVARRLGVNQSTISRLESGQITPTLHMLRKYCGVIGVDIFYRVESSSTSRVYVLAGGESKRAVRGRYTYSVNATQPWDSYEAAGRGARDVFKTRVSA